ncbi:MAG: nuclear transport factor 2 family protein [Candidatus Obscuribacterales bacterium]|nr:nuclear transport factor 2 family protein [Steroidobacteraceae bacterium]
MKIVNTSLLALALLASPLLASAETLTTQDYAEIEQLYARYNHAIDSVNAEAWADTFTADGVFNARFTGREQLMGFIKTWKERMNGGNRRHWNSNLSITGSPEGANGAVYLMLWDVGVKPQAIVSTGMYADTLVKTPNGWRFKTRVVKGDAAPAVAPAAAPTPAPAPAPAK